MKSFQISSRPGCCGGVNPFGHYTLFIIESRSQACGNGFFSNFIWPFHPFSLPLHCQLFGTMRTRAEYIDILSLHAGELRSRYGISSMRLFGSVMRNGYKEGSDVDFFVTMPLQFLNYIAASQYLKSLLSCDVDLKASHNRIRPFFRKQIEQDGIDIYNC